MRITTGLMAGGSGNEAPHTAKAAADEGLAHAFTYEADKRRSSERRT